MHKYETIVIPRAPDREKEQSEKKRTLHDFLEAYNTDLPKAFPRATEELLLEYRASHRSMFKNPNIWTLADHRKRFMDWVPQRLRELER